MTFIPKEKPPTFKWMKSLDEFLKLDNNDIAKKRVMPVLKPKVDYLASQVRFLKNKEAVREMVLDLLSLDVRVLAIDTEYRFKNKKFLRTKKDGSPRQNSKEWTDIRSIVPLLLSLCAVIDGKKIVYVVDLRVEGVAEPLQKLFDSGVKLAVHYVKAEYHCLKTLGIQLPDRIFDTHLAGLALNLGRFHHRYINENPSSDQESSENKAQADEKKVYHASLLGLCKTYQVPHRFQHAKQSLQRSFDKVGPSDVFSQEQIDYAAEDAIATADLYFHLSYALLNHDLTSHMERIEFPYALANAECEWVGVKVSEDACKIALQGLRKAVREFERKFKAEPYSIINPNSRTEIQNLFSRLGILDHFKIVSRVKKTGKLVAKYSFNKELLDRNEKVHEIVACLRTYKKYHQKSSEKLFHGEFRSLDGRVHARLSQLGADTGRTTSVDPPLNSTGKIFRPIVVPELGWLVGEADLSQIEMGVAAAMSGDPQAIDDYNCGDIYMAMAKRVFRTQLTEAQLAHSVKEFKKDPVTHELRDRMKVFCLGVIYNMSAAGVARDLGISEARAKMEIETFFSFYPTLRVFMEDSARYGGFRGYARSTTGLKRFRADSSKPPTHWEINWLRNMPIQASAADLFKLIVIRLTKEYHRYNAKLILQIYDAVVFEAPEKDFATVAMLTQEVMEQTVSEVFPVLRGKADLNDEAPFCWNKDGKTDSISKFLENPEYRI